MMSSFAIKESFLSLIRLGIGHSTAYLPHDIDWQRLNVMALEQGLSAIMIDGIESVPKRIWPSQEILHKWVFSVIHTYEHRYDMYTKAISELAAFYNSHGFKMMLLKGVACGINWPEPKHRPCGDIDIWLFGKQKEADDVMIKENDISIDNSHQHHSVFTWGDFSVENHYDFINVHHHKSNADFEKILKELGQDDSHSIEVGGEKVYLPSANLNALFLLKHNMIHFAAEGITLRQLLDWAFFVEKHSAEIDWRWLEDVLDRFGMKKLYDIFNAICVDDLGFDVTLFNSIQFDPILKERVLGEILSPKFPIEPPKGLFDRIPFKLHRWKENAWKHKLCYKESMWSAFWSGVWNHILKPSSI